MTHTEALNLILAHACAVEVNGDNRHFIIDVHCQEFEVVATLASTMNTVKYDIVSVRAL